MKLYSLLILTENTKKSKNNFKVPKKSEIVVFPGRILPCKQDNYRHCRNKTTLLIRQSKETYYSKSIETNKNNPRMLSKLFKNLVTNRLTLTPLRL